jgi:hypothetical protein
VLALALFGHDVKALKYLGLLIIGNSRATVRHLQHELAGLHQQRCIAVIGLTRSITDVQLNPTSACEGQMFKLILEIPRLNDVQSNLPTAYPR